MKFVLSFFLLVCIQILPSQAHHSSRFGLQKEAASAVSICIVPTFIENNKHPTASQNKPIKEEISQEPKPKKPGTKTKKAPNVDVLREDGIDPVCSMKVTKGTTSVSTFGGKQYGFCSGMCKERFDKNPDKYLSKVKK